MTESESDTTIYKELFVFSLEMLCILEWDGSFKDVSLGFEEAVGHEASSLHGEPFVNFVHPDDRPGVLAGMAEVKRGARSHTIDARFQGRDGRARRLSLRITKRPRGEHLFCAAREKTDFQAEARHFKALAEATSDYIAVANQDGTIVYLNPSGKAMIGLAGEIPKGFRPEDVLAPASHRLWQEEVEPAMLTDGIWRGEAEIRHSSGESIPISMVRVVLRGEDGRPEAFATIARDVRAEKHSQAGLRRFKAMADVMPDFIGMAMLTGEILYVNRSGMALVGRDGEDFRDLSVADFQTAATKEHFQREVLPAVVRDGIWTGEAELLHKSGAAIPIHRIIILMRDAAGNPESFASIARDLRQQKRLEDALRQSIRELSVPIIQVWDGVLALPIVGLVDSARAAQMTEALLNRIVSERSRVAIIDLTGVDAIDTSTVSHLFKLVSAARLLGSRAIISGLSSHVAQTIVGLGVDLSGLHIVRSLREGLRLAMSDTDELL